MPERTDDATVADHQLVYRAIWDSRDAFTKNEDGSFRPSSAAFKDRLSSEVSVFVADLTTVDKVMENFPSFGLVSIEAGLARSLGFIVAKTPEEDDPDDPSHRVICPKPGMDKKKIGKAAKTMALNAVWVRLPESVR